GVGDRTDRADARARGPVPGVERGHRRRGVRADHSDRLRLRVRAQPDPRRHRGPHRPSRRLTKRRARAGNVLRSAMMTATDRTAAALFDFTLRPSQRQTVDAVVSGRDTLAVLPTGSGKSAIYQVAGLTIGGLTLVISPLIALQRDQIRSIAGRR